MVLPLVVELSSDGFVVMVIEDGAATGGEAKVGGIEDPFLLKVPSTLIVCKSHCTDVGAPKCVGGVR